MPTVTDDRTPAAHAADGPVLVRVDASTGDWVRGLPSVPDGHRVGLTVSDTSLMGCRDELDERGYDLLAVVPGRRSGVHADLLVTPSTRADAPRWFAALLLVADRVFDLRFGPVRMLLRAELTAHDPDLTALPTD